MRNGPNPVNNPNLPSQLSLVLDTAQLRGLHTAERDAVITCLAHLLMEAAGATTEETGDDGQ